MVRKTRKKQRKSSKIKRHMNKTKRKYKNRRKNTSKTKNKNQSGGFLDVLGIGLGAIAGIAALAFAGYKYTNVVEDKNIIELLLNNTANIEYLPKYSLIAHSIKSKSSSGDTYIDRYLKCVSNTEFIDFIRENPDLLKTSTIKSILKNISDIDSSLNSLNKLLSNYEDIGDEYEQHLTINTIKLVETDDKLLNELKVYLLATSEYSKNSRDYELDIQNKLAKSGVNWIDIIFDGGSDFDPIFDGEVDKLLEDRGSLNFVNSNITELLKSLKDNYELVESINHKMRDCTNTPEGYLNFITKDITWNASEKCLECPKEDCLIYIYQYYYSFLNKESEIRILDKIYILMLCEARICLLSKCIVLEALRQEKGNKTFVKSILDKIYERDKKRNTTSANIPEEYSNFTMIKKPTKKTLNKRDSNILSGGGDDILPVDGDTGKKDDEGTSVINDITENTENTENTEPSNSVLENSNDIITSQDDKYMDNLLNDENQSSEKIPPEEKESFDSNSLGEDKSIDEGKSIDEDKSLELMDDSNEETIDKEYLLIRKLLDIDLSNYLIIHSKNLQMIVEQYNSLVNNKQDKKDLELRKIIIKDSTPQNIESNIEELFPIFEYVLKSHNKYMNINSLCRPEFENYYDLYCRYNKIFMFISPRLIGIRFFKLKKDINKDYWNYDMEEMIIKANSILLNGLIDDELTDIVYKFITISLLSSRKPGKGSDEDIQIIDKKQLPDITKSSELDSIGLPPSIQSTDQQPTSQQPTSLQPTDQQSITDQPSTDQSVSEKPAPNVTAITSSENISALKDLESIKNNSLSTPPDSLPDNNNESKSESKVNMSDFTPINVDESKSTEDTSKKEDTGQTEQLDQKSDSNQVDSNQVDSNQTGNISDTTSTDQEKATYNSNAESVTNESESYLENMTKYDKVSSTNSLGLPDIKSNDDSEKQPENTTSNEDPNTPEDSKSTSVDQEKTEDAPKEITESSTIDEGSTSSGDSTSTTGDKTQPAEGTPLPESSVPNSDSTSNTIDSSKAPETVGGGGESKEESKEEGKEKRKETNLSDKDKELLNNIIETDNKDNKENISNIKIIENTNINIENLDYIITSKNEQMLSSIVDNISEIYSISKEEDIVKFIKYIVDINDNKYNNFISYLRKNTVFMNSLESDNSLYKELYDKNIFEDIDKVRSGKSLTEIEESNYFNNNECVGMKTKLAKIIKTGGPLTELDLRRLEDCDKKNTRTLNKKSTKKAKRESSEDMLEN
jgi:hypothetical protein